LKIFLTVELELRLLYQGRKCLYFSLTRVFFCILCPFSHVESQYYRYECARGACLSSKANFLRLVSLLLGRARDKPAPRLRFVIPSKLDCLKLAKFLRLELILCFCEGKGAGSSGGSMGSVRLRDLPDLRDPVSESVSGVPTEPGVNNFYCSFLKTGLSINAFWFICLENL